MHLGDRPRVLKPCTWNRQSWSEMGCQHLPGSKLYLEVKLTQGVRVKPGYWQKTEVPVRGFGTRHHGHFGYRICRNVWEPVLELKRLQSPRYRSSTRWNHTEGTQHACSAPTRSSVYSSPEHGLNGRLNSREGDGVKKQGIALFPLFSEINIRCFVIQRWEYNWVFRWSWKNLSLKAFQEFKI